MYCRNCGNEISPQAIACTKCGVPPMKGNHHCYNCGAETNGNAIMCIKCGVGLNKPNENVIPVSETKEIVRLWGKYPYSTYILILLFSLMPFVNFKCGEYKIVSVTGFDMATGSTIENPMTNEHQSLFNWDILTFYILIGISLIALTSDGSHKFKTARVLTIIALGILVEWFIVKNVTLHTQEYAELKNILSWGLGFWLTAITTSISLILVTIYLKQENDRDTSNKDLPLKTQIHIEQLKKESSAATDELDNSPPIKTIPQNVRLAINLLIVSLAIGTVGGIVKAASVNGSQALPSNGISSSAIIGTTLVILILTIAVEGFFIYKISTGKNWARVLTIIMMGLGIVYLPFSLPKEIEQGALLGVSTLVNTLLQGTACILLIQKDANYWFKYKTVSIVEDPKQYHSATWFEEKGTWLIVIVIVFFGAFLYFFFYKNTQSTNPTAVANQPVSQQMQQQTVEPTQTPTTDQPSNVNYTTMQNVVNNLLQAEEQQNLSGILACFSDNVAQYWDLNHPSQSQIEDRYNKAWVKANNIAYQNISIEQVNNNTIDLTATYSFYSIKDDITKSVPTHVRYVFDNNGKIISTYGIKSENVRDDSTSHSVINEADINAIKSKIFRRSDYDQLDKSIYLQILKYYQIEYPNKNLECCEGPTEPCEYLYFIEKDNEHNEEWTIHFASCYDDSNFKFRDFNYDNKLDFSIKVYLDNQGQQEQTLIFLNTNNNFILSKELTKQ